MAENNSTEPMTQAQDSVQNAAAEDHGREQHEPEKKYTDDDVNKIINRKFAEWQKKSDEAAKLSAMNAQEKSEYELKQMKEELASLKKEKAFNEMKAVASEMLTEAGVVVFDSVVKMLVSDDAEETKTRVTDFARAYRTALQAEQVKSVHKGTPRTGSTSTITKEDIRKVANPLERQRLIRRNIKLFTGEN